MKITPISKAFFGVPETDEEFDLQAATNVYRWYLATPEAEQIMIHALAEEVPRLERYHAGEIKKFVDERYEKRKEIIKRAVINGAISKSMSDETIEEIAKAVDLIEKARESEYTLWERRENTRRQWRDKQGRFRQMGSIQIQPPATSRPVDHDTFNRLTPERFTPADKPPKLSNGAMADYQNSYAQIAGALENYDYKDVSAVLVWNTPQGERVSEVLGSKPEDIIHPDDFSRKTLNRVTFWALGDDATNPNSYDAMRELGSSRRFADEVSYQVSEGGLSTNKIKAFNDDWEKQSAWDESGLTRGMRRLGAASGFAESVFGNVEDPRVKAAIQAGKWAGQYGPEAEKVIGPHARKSAYRYRGVERKADAALNNAYRSAIATATTPTDARTRIIYPRVTEQVVGRGQNARSIGVPVESPVINYFRGILPKEELLRLHTNSGAIAPSQGIIINSKGQIDTQAVGYGDDHYLPFNLRNLKALKGGEYIRTRTLGGPTTEDVYTGMVSGARAFTVVSHSGVYTVEFADDFRGGRRLNDKSARMVKRYGMLLDSLEAEQVTLSPVPKERQEELMLKAKGKFPGDDEGSRKSRLEYFERLRKEEQQEPKPAASLKEEWANEFLDMQAARYDDGQGTELTWKDVRGQALARAAREGGEDPDSIARQFSTPASTIVALGLGEEYDKFLKSKESEYVATQKPLRLNGEGYHKALQALQEQFPYYIANVEYRPWEKTSNQKDAGYVKPRYNRPAAIKAGYWDTSIEGKVGLKVTDAKTGEKKDTGKVTADQTNYQNWTARNAVRQKNKAEEKDETKPGTPSTPGSPSDPGSAVLPPIIKAKNRADLGSLMRGSEVRIKAKNGNWIVPGSDDRAGMAQRYPILMGVDADEIQRRYVEDDNFRRDVDAEAKKALIDNDIQLPYEFKSNFDSTGVNQTKPFSADVALTDRKSWFTFGDEADSTLGGNPEITAADIETFVENNDDLYTARESVGLNGMSDSTGLTKIESGLKGVNDKMVELARAQAKGEFSRGDYTFIDATGQSHSTYEEAKTALDLNVRNLTKLRQAKRRYDELNKRGGGPTYRVVGFTPPSEGGDQGGAAPAGGTPAPAAPVAGVSLKPIDSVYGPTMQRTTDEELDRFNAMSDAERKKYLSTFNKRMARGYYSLRRI